VDRIHADVRQLIRHPWPVRSSARGPGQQRSARDGSQADASDALRREDRTNQRGRAFHAFWLARTQLDQGKLDQACDTATQALVPASAVASERVSGHLREFYAQLAPYRQEPVALAFEARLRELLPPWPKTVLVRTGFMASACRPPCSGRIDGPMMFSVRRHGSVTTHQASSTFSPVSPCPGRWIRRTYACRTERHRCGPGRVTFRAACALGECRVRCRAGQERPLRRRQCRSASRTSLRAARDSPRGRRGEGRGPGPRPLNGVPAPRHPSWDRRRPIRTPVPSAPRDAQVPPALLLA
jgi:hypothetical protein